VMARWLSGGQSVRVGTGTEAKRSEPKDWQVNDDLVPKQVRASVDPR
jgi:hypothetical protein